MSISREISVAAFFLSGMATLSAISVGSSECHKPPRESISSKVEDRPELQAVGLHSEIGIPGEVTEILLRIFQPERQVIRDRNLAAKAEYQPLTVRVDEILVGQRDRRSDERIGMVTPHIQTDTGFQAQQPVPEIGTSLTHLVGIYFQPGNEPCPKPLLSKDQSVHRDIVPPGAVTALRQLNTAPSQLQAGIDARPMRFVGMRRGPSGTILCPGMRTKEQ